MVCYNQNPASHLAAELSTDGSTSDFAVPEVVHQHARLLYQAMISSHEEFDRVLYSALPIDVAYLVKTAKLLDELNAIYEENSQLEVVMIEQQISAMLKKYLPELACVAFKALKDGYSVSWSGESSELHLLDFDSVSYISCRSRSRNLFSELNIILELSSLDL